MSFGSLWGYRVNSYMHMKLLVSYSTRATKWTGICSFSCLCQWRPSHGFGAIMTSMRIVTRPQSGLHWEGFKKARPRVKLVAIRPVAMKFGATYLCPYPHTIALSRTCWSTISVRHYCVIDAKTAEKLTAVRRLLTSSVGHQF